LKVAVTDTLFCRTTVQVGPDDVLQPLQPPKVEVPCGFAVRTIVVPTVNALLQVFGVEQVIPAGTLVMFPVPDPLKLTVRTAWAPDGVHPNDDGPFTTTEAELLGISLPLA